MKMWRCDVCGYIYEGEDPPENCPKCTAPRDKFVLLDEEEAEMMQEAFQTKEKYARILEKLQEVDRLAQEGIALNLDDGCNQIFARTRKDISAIRKMIQEELAGHAQMCIWVKVASDGELA